LTLCCAFLHTEKLEQNIEWLDSFNQPP
jgi:hypothetical protein